MGHWIFDGYESASVPGKNGKIKKVLIYKGEKYGLDLTITKKRQLKLSFLSLGLLYTALLLLLSFFPSAGGMDRLVGLCLILCLVPLIFLWLGLINYIIAGPLWEIRKLYAGYRRMGRAALISCVLTAMALIAEVYYLIRYPDTWQSEMYYVAGLIVCLTAVLIFLWLFRRYPARGLKGADIS